jgi:hypothetical protein
VSALLRWDGLWSSNIHFFIRSVAGFEVDLILVLCRSTNGVEAVHGPSVRGFPGDIHTLCV